MQSNHEDLAALLARRSEGRTEARRLTAELAAGIYECHQLTHLADQLAQEFGPALLTREELLAWLAEQIERIKAAGIVDCNSAMGMINNAYLELLIDDAYLGPMLGSPSIH